MSNNDFFSERSLQSAVKAELVEQYFKSWARIMKNTAKKYNRKDNRLAFFDLFCGPGRYEDCSAKHRFLSLEPLLEKLGPTNLKKIAWVIVGGESGPGARPMQKEWVRDLRDQCEKKKVAFHFKQWGGVQKKKNGRILDKRTHDDTPLTCSIAAE